MPVTVLLATLIAGCGGSGGSADATTPAEATAPAETTVSDPSAAESEPITTTTAGQATETTAGDGGTTLSGETSGTLDLDGETYTFGLSELASCDTERLGSFYEAQLAHVDDSGEPIGEEGIWIILPLTDQGDITISAFVAGITWTAGEGTGAGFPGDTHTVDGQRAEGTLTFVTAAGAEAEGNFEVFCAGR